MAVAGSTSKAENVNAALAVATGEIIAVFDADHHPEPGGFERAWPTLAAGADVVQGRCAVRLGDRLPSAIVAAEIRADVRSQPPGSGPGSDGFGIFGGSNAFWRAAALRRHRLDPTMLTEDIDVSMRVRSLPAAGSPSTPAWSPGNSRRRRSPPCATREPAGPSSARRSITHLRGLVGSRRLTLRQRAGAVILFAWGPMYTWLSGLAAPMLFGRALNGRGVALPALLLGLVAFGAMAAKPRWPSGTLCRRDVGRTPRPSPAHLAARVRRTEERRRPRGPPPPRRWASRLDGDTQTYGAGGPAGHAHRNLWSRRPHSVWNTGTRTAAVVRAHPRWLPAEPGAAFSARRRSSGVATAPPLTDPRHCRLSAIPCGQSSWFVSVHPASGPIAHQRPDRSQGYSTSQVRRVRRHKLMSTPRPLSRLAVISLALASLGSRSVIRSRRPIVRSLSSSVRCRTVQALYRS